MAKLFRLTEWRNQAKIEFIESAEDSFDDPALVFGFMKTKAVKFVNALLANGIWPIIDLLSDTADTRLTEDERNELATCRPASIPENAVVHCRKTTWNGRPMIEFSACPCPDDEDERRRFRFGSSKAAKVVKAILADGIEPVVSGLAEVAGDGVDQKSVASLLGQLSDSPDVESKGTAIYPDMSPEQVLREISYFIKHRSLNDTEALQLLQEAARCIRGLLMRNTGIASPPARKGQGVSVGELVDEVESLL